MSSPIVPNENSWDGIDDTLGGNGPSDNGYLDSVGQARKAGTKNLKTSVKQGADLSTNRRLFIERVASKIGGDKEKAVATAQRDYSSLVRTISLQIQSQNTEISIQDAKLQAEQQVLSRPKYINSLAGSRLKNAVANETKKMANKALKGALKKAGIRVLLSNPIVLIVLVVCCCLSILGLILFSQFKAATSDAQSAFTTSTHLISCAGLPADIQRPTFEEMQKIYDCQFNQKNEEYSSSEPIPE